MSSHLVIVKTPKDSDPAFWSSDHSAGAVDYWIRVCLSVRLSVFPSVRLSDNNFCSALDLPYYWEESNETLHSERIFIVVVHLGIGFIEQRKMCL